LTATGNPCYSYLVTEEGRELGTAGAIEAILARDCQVTKGATHLIAQTLRGAGMLPKGPAGRGAPLLTSDEAAAFLLSVASGVSVSDVVTATHSLTELPRARQSEDFEANDKKVLHGMRLASARTSGDAIASMLDDIRIGAFAAWGGELLFVSFADTHDRLSITARHPSHNHASIIQFKRRKAESDPLLRRDTYIDCQILKNVADALGPIERK
jgi:hypothetical protein